MGESALHKLVYIMGIIFIIWIIALSILAYLGYTSPEENEEEANLEIPIKEAIPQEQVLINETKDIDKEIIYSRTIELYKEGIVSVDISSDRLVGFVLLPDYELRHFREGESYRSYEDVSSLKFFIDEYRLDKGKYALVIVTGERDTEISWVVKVR